MSARRAPAQGLATTSSSSSTREEAGLGSSGASMRRASAAQPEEPSESDFPMVGPGGEERDYDPVHPAKVLRPERFRVDELDEALIDELDRPMLWGAQVTFNQEVQQGMHTETL